MDALIESIVQSAPYTAPMIIAIGWLVKQLSDARKEVKDKTVQVEQLLTARADELKEAAVEYAENGEATRSVLKDWMAKADIVLARAGAGR